MGGGTPPPSHSNEGKMTKGKGASIAKKPARKTRTESPQTPDEQLDQVQATQDDPHASVQDQKTIDIGSIVWRKQ